MKTLIIGNGEIGKSLFNVLAPHHQVAIRDIEEGPLLTDVEVLNICYPYSDKFVETTKEYIAKYKPRITIINSTVKVGTTRQLGEYVVHSPCHGKHPNLEQGMKTFVKYIGGINIFAVAEADKFFKLAGLDTEIVSSPESSELSKILCTTQYGWNLILMKEIAKICNETGIPFKEVYSNWNTFYNEGYAKLGMPEFTRPRLIPVDGPIGGHCVIPNCDLLPGFITDTIKERNETYKKSKNESKKLLRETRSSFKRHEDISSKNKRNPGL